MGRDKALLTLPAQPAQTFLAQLAALLTSRCHEVVLVARDAEQATHYASLVPASVRAISDQVPAQGPLMGLYSGLSAISCSHAFVTAVDTPLLQPSLINYLLAQSHSDSPLIPLVNGIPQVLLAVYPRAILPILAERLTAGRKDLRSLLEVLPVRFLPEDELRIIDPALRSFVNVNTPEELAELQ